MRSKIQLTAAPVGLSPGGYVPKAYASRTSPHTPVAELEVVRAQGGPWRVRIAWDCGEAVQSLGDDVNRFVDAAAVLAPSAEDSPFMTMGAPGKAVEGALWRADRAEPFSVRAEGLGTVERSEAPVGWSARAEWKGGRWQVDFSLSGFVALDRYRRLAIAVWQGAESDRGGLKSVSSGWIDAAS